MNRNHTDSPRQNEEEAVFMIAALIGGLLMTAYSFLWYQPKYRTVSKIY